MAASPGWTPTSRSSGGSRWFTGLDASWAYHSIPCAPRTRKYLFMAAPNKTLVFTRLTFELSNAGYYYSRMVEELLKGVPESACLRYYDDLLVHSKTINEHLKWLDIILGLHVQHSVLLNPKKSQILRDTVSYLGFQISQDGYTIKTSYLEKLRQWPVPSSLRGVEGLLGFLQYYRQ